MLFLHRLTSNPNWGWRALRILSQKSLHFFTSTNQPAKSLPNYLDTMVCFLVANTYHQLFHLIY